MKNFLLHILLPVCLLAGIQLHAQNIPIANNQATGSNGVSLPNAYNSNGNTAPANFNFTRTWTPQVPLTSAATPSDPGVYAMSTTYFNGFGQALQSNIKLAKDIVTVYDNRSLLNKPSYLPYVANTGSIGFQLSPFQDQKAWYTAQYGNEGDNAYSRTEVKATGNVHSTTAYAAGAAFTGNNRGVKSSGDINTLADGVLQLSIVNGVPVKQGFYANGELTSTKTEGQHNARSIAYTDRSGQVICKRVEVGEGSSKILHTYYVYDELGRIAWIITPKAFEALEDISWSGSTVPDILDGLCYGYVYDRFGQVIERNIPGKDRKELTVYDSKHRPVLQQTPLLNTRGQWAFQVYDNRSRVALSGLLSSSDDRLSWQGIADGTNVPAIIETGGLIDLILHECNGAQPEAMTGCEILQHNYYDSYAFDPLLPLNGRSFYTGGANDFLPMATCVQPVPYGFVQGQLTATRTRVTGSGNPFTGSWTSTVYFYDQKGRVIQTQTQYPWNDQAWDIATTQYTFTGNIARNILYHQALPGSQKTGITKMMVTRSYEAGQLGRLTNTALLLDNKLSNLATYAYDELGRLKEKSIGGIEKQKYTYNIRGQLTGINPEYVENRTYADATFGCRLSYDYGFTNSRYDGSIAGIAWRGAGSKANIRAYGYDYDAGGRLIRADFSKKHDGLMQAGQPEWDNSEEDFSVSEISYDANGNMQTMNQEGMAQLSNGIQKVNMDRLSYYYAQHSNKLTTTEDALDPAINAAYGLNDFVNRNQGQSSIDYEYDADGNLTMDRNKDIREIIYNHQDLPETIISGSATITNVYDATGTLLQKTISIPGQPGNKIYRYVGPFVYENGQLSYVLHEEGRSRWIQDSLGWRNDYFIKDHLGNVRTVITKDQVGIRNYVATHEPGLINGEKKMFDVNADPGVKPASGDPDDQVAVDLNGAVSGRQLGTSLMIKVMAGDKFKAEVSAYYDPQREQENGEVITQQGMGNALIDALSGGITSIGSEAGVTGTLIGNMFGSGEFVSSYGPLVNNSTDPNQPKAYLHYVLFDESLKVVPGQSGAIQVTSDNAGRWSLLEMPEELEVGQNGFLVVFMGNLDPHWTSMDNLKVTYSQGRLLEEQHYYPHGLAVQDGSHSPLVNRYLYQGKELLSEGGVQLMDFHARQYDPQIGRFAGIDPLDEFPSGYTGMGNNPANLVDPSGMRTEGPQGYSASSNGGLNGGWHWEFFGDGGVFDWRHMANVSTGGGSGGSLGGGNFDNMVVRAWIEGGQGFAIGTMKYSLSRGMGFWYDRAASNWNADASGGYSPGNIGVGGAAIMSKWIGMDFQRAMLGGRMEHETKNEAFSAAIDQIWYSDLARAFVPDALNVSLGGSWASGVGAGIQPINVTILTRGKTPGVYLAPSYTVLAGVTNKIEGGISFGPGYYTGDPHDIDADMIPGHSFGFNISGKLIDGISLGGSYSPTGNGHGFINGNIGFGGGIGFALEGQYQYTFGYAPLWTWKK